MSVTTKLLTGAAGLAAIAGFATPAAAQYYPGTGYGYNNGSGIVGAIINSVTGYGRYPYGNYGYSQYGNQYGGQYGNQYGGQYGSQYGYNQNMAVEQCARAVEARLNGGNGYYGYGNVPYRGGYNGYGYNQGYGGGRVQGITKVDRKSYGLKVHGVASSGYNGYNGYGRQGYGNYGYNAGADLSFDCEVRYDGRIRDIDVKRRTAYWRGY
ncbi:MAG TPA: hypothetical protein VFT40_01370 [Sphingomicrobium sp.]|jgi:hypothetical protein|nr:hypothetical protein [Sphingomicrobium sp.]